jgi:hypothetical protein
MAYLRRSRTCNWYVYWVRNDADDRNQARLCIQGPEGASRSSGDQELFGFDEIRRMLVTNDFTSIPGCSGTDLYVLVPVLREFVVDVQEEFSSSGVERGRIPSALYCRHCGQRLGVDEILGLAHMAPAGCLYFHCPECKAQSFLDFSDAGIAIGYFDGFPGPNFIPVSSLSVEKLHVANFPGGLRVSIGERDWSFEKELLHGL